VAAPIGATLQAAKRANAPALEACLLDAARSPSLASAQFPDPRQDLCPVSR